MRSQLTFFCVISLLLLALAVADHSPARTAPFILKPNIPLAPGLTVDLEQNSAFAGRKPAALEIEPVTEDELIQMSR